VVSASYRKQRLLTCDSPAKKSVRVPVGAPLLGLVIAFEIDCLAQCLLLIEGLVLDQYPAFTVLELDSTSTHLDQ
jgi:hypothetical protein